MGQLTTPHLLGIKNINSDDIRLIFETADEFKTVINRPIKKVPSLRDITVANIFFENSTRTRISFELAQKRLSADVVNFSASGSSVSKGETLIDTVRNILAMKVDMVVMRHPVPGAHIFLAKHIDAQIINAGDGTHEHPTQGLLDAYSIREKLGSLEGKKVVMVGDEECFADLLFYNRKLQCLVAFDLKKGKFKPEYVGKMNFYLSALDEYIKQPHELPAIGIILCKEKNNKIVEFSFRDFKKAMGVATYKTSNELPKKYKNALPDVATLKKMMG